MANKALRDAVLKAAAKPAGLFTPTELPGFTVVQVGMMARLLADQGRLFRIDIKGGRLGRFRRYFTSASAARNYRPATESIRPSRAKASPWEGVPPCTHVFLPAPPAQFDPDPWDEGWKSFSASRPGEYTLPASKWVEAVV